MERISPRPCTVTIVTMALTAMNNNSGEPWIPQTMAADWKFIDNTLYFKHRLYVPKPAHHDLVKSLHEPPAGGHEGFFQTLHCMQRDYWWLGMSTFLRRFISGCADCQAAKVNTHPTVPRLSPLAVETSLPFSSISVDLITGLPESHGCDSVMVMVDHGCCVFFSLAPLNPSLTPIKTPRLLPRPHLPLLLSCSLGTPLSLPFTQTPS